MHRLRSHLTYANVMASVAVFIALGGTSYAAAKIGSAQIKNNTIQGKDVKNSSLTSGDVKDRSLLSRDFRTGQLPAGPRGATGAPGAPGPAGAAGATNAVVRAITRGSHVGFSNETVTCQPGERATGGGAIMLDTNGAIAGAVANDNLAYSGPIDSSGRPAADGTTPTGWAMKLQAGNGGGTRSFRYYAVCVAP